jgi:hypothetical protein
LLSEAASTKFTFKFQDNLKVKAQKLEDRVKTAFRKADIAYGVDPGF